MSSPRNWWRPTAVDSRDARAFGFPAVRTLLVRVVLAAGAIVVLAAATASAMGLDPRDRGLLQEGTGVVVVDLSLSIEDDTSGAVRNALKRLIAADAPVGLVVFSDVPYELLPPGTPPSELKGLVRMLTPVAGVGVVNPWSDTFRAGTRISSAMQLAREMLQADNVKNGSVLLISDLETAPDDVPALARALRALRRDDIPVHLVALGPSSDSRLLFGEILGQDAFEPPPPPPERSDATPAEVRRPLPRGLLVLGAVFLLALAAHELFAGRLALPRAPRLRRRAA
jgi:hypothetical protein